MAKQPRSESVAADAEARGMVLAAQFVRSARKATQEAKSLKTGNPGARKPGKGATFLVTQESFDVAFDAGRAYAGAYHAAAEALQPILAPLAGQTTQAAVNQWRELQRAFTLGMAEAREIDPDSARKAFNRITDYLGLAKPQTPEAARKQAQRAAAKPAEPDGAGAEDDDSPKAGAGAAAAASVAMELSRMEAHLIALVRAGKFEMAAECVASMAEPDATE